MATLLPRRESNEEENSKKVVTVAGLLAVTASQSLLAALPIPWVVIGLQFVVILVLWFGWSQAPKQLTVHVPPDLCSGATLSVDEVPAANVYAFAFYIFQQLNRWPEDGAKDYGKAIFRISPYVTPRYRTELMADLEQKGRKGELVYLITSAVECKLKWLLSRSSDICLKGYFRSPEADISARGLIIAMTD